MFSVDLDLSDVLDLMDLPDVSEKEARKHVANLAAETHQHAIELANQRLHTRRGMFVEALDHFQIDADTWVVDLKASARWIDEGQDPHSMLDDLLRPGPNKKVHTAKDGSTYVVVPFQHNKPRGELTPQQQLLLQAVKSELRKVGSTPNGIETNAHGEPKLGLVRELDIMQRPINTSELPIGKGRFGDVAQGPTGIPLLQGVRVYQKEIPNVGAGPPKVGRYVMTFRVASSKHAGQGRWDHPGLEKVDIMRDSAEWALQQWQRKVGPALINSIIAKLK